MFAGPLAELIAQIEKLPGLGAKSASRLAFHILRMPEDGVRRLADSMVNARTSLRLCAVCQDFADEETCRICDDPDRDRTTLCVVADPKDVVALERLHEYKGLYHVLHGLLSPLDGVGPEDIKVRELIGRLGDGVSEVIIATNPTVEGEATALYIASLVKPSGIVVSRLAHGLPAGGEVEYADSATLVSALEFRRPI
ncbi:MAG: recombination protein RecR [Fimbriimonadaceae bacterium]|nr:recombination protein RecR [Fimbriimonadaceae bacterium]